jgi:hypothetical protein
MNARDAIQLNLDMANMVCGAYLADLEDRDLLVRPGPGCNHIAWQLGHLIESEHDMMELVKPGSMSPLPVGFGDRHTKSTSRIDSASAFLSKGEYLELYQQQRQGTLALLRAQSDAELDLPAPEKFQAYSKSRGDLFSLQGSHLMMHVGQWAVVRRKLGRPPLF